MDTIQIDMPVTSAEQAEIIVAGLSDKGFHGFEENDNILSAFIIRELFDEDILRSILSRLKISYTKKTITEINWNQKWESDFYPVIIDSFAVIRAAFHATIKGVEHEIIITPKMSFGTGHHPTTYLMLQQMKEIDFKNKRVLDFGTGTGVLSILANKLGAHSITAIDNDEWSIENAKENFTTNNCDNILLIKSDSLDDLGVFDIILANINLNVIKANIAALKQACHPATELLLSGFLSYDKDELKRLFSSNSFQVKSIKQKDGWISMSYYVEK